MLNVMCQLEFSTSRILSAHDVTTAYNYTRTNVPSFYEHIWQLTLENNHELQIFADFIVIV